MLLLITLGCTPPSDQVDTENPTAAADDRIQPVWVTPPVPGDADDPAIWVNPTDPQDSRVVGTDKEESGGVHVYDLQGNELEDRAHLDMQQPNNVTVQTDFELGGELVDIAVVTEFEAEQLRVYRLPDMEPIDGGGIPVFVGEEGDREEPAGVGLYRRPSDGAVFAHVSRDAGPSSGYLWTYRLRDDGTGTVTADYITRFGAFSGEKDIESVVVDDELGVLYYCDEFFGVRKYPADPDDPAFGIEIASFAYDGYSEAREGVALYRGDDGTGYILVSDQLGNRVMVYPREGYADDPDDHRFLGYFRTTAVETDGMDAAADDFGGVFSSGLFVQHSDEGSFHYFTWDDIEAGIIWQDTP